MRTNSYVRTQWLLTALLGGLLGGALLAAGCGGKEDKLDTQAPPPSIPNAVPEKAENKPRPPAPPSMGAPPGPAPGK